MRRSALLGALLLASTLVGAGGPSLALAPPPAVTFGPASVVGDGGHDHGGADGHEADEGLALAPET
ncbi:MAG TPA: hypothetical protein VK988_04115, partial [Acidimicrobiales bacterium]|nr:hypothetical protein [Acidimicrobiales bacterium]